MFVDGMIGSAFPTAHVKYACRVECADEGAGTVRGLEATRFGEMTGVLAWRLQLTRWRCVPVLC